MATAKRKYSPRITDETKQALRNDYLRTPMDMRRAAKAVLCKKYNIRSQTYHRIVKDLRGQELVEKPRLNLSVVEPVHNPNVIDRCDRRTRGYIKGMAMAFDVSEERIIETLVEMALEIGAVEFHAKG